jgi:hypothetical protein
MQDRPDDRETLLFGSGVVLLRARQSTTLKSQGVIYATRLVLVETAIDLVRRSVSIQSKLPLRLRQLGNGSGSPRCGIGVAANGVAPKGKEGTPDRCIWT